MKLFFKVNRFLLHLAKQKAYSQEAKPLQNEDINTFNTRVFRIPYFSGTLLTGAFCYNGEWFKIFTRVHASSVNTLRK